jgi:voltage-gated potassium channel Kch
VGLSILCKAVDTAYYYSDPDWKYYIQYNKIRGKINDNPNGRRASLELPPLLSKEDYELLLNFTPNPEAIDLALLQQIHQAIDQKTLSPKLRNVKQLLWYGPWLLLAFVYMGMLFFEQEKTAKLQMLASSVIFIGLLGFVTLNATLKARVFFPAFGAYIFFCCWVSGQALQHRKMVIASTAILLVSLGLLVKSYTWSASLRPKIATYERQLSMIHHYLGEGKKLAVYRGSLPLEKNDPFTLSASFPTQQIYLSGWMTGIPFHKGKYDAFDFFIEKNGLFVHQQNSFSKTAALVGASILQHDTIMVRSRVASEAEACAIIEFDELSSFDEN